MSCQGCASRPCEGLGLVLEVDSPSLIPGLCHLMIRYWEPKLLACSVYTSIMLIAWEISPAFCCRTVMEFLTNKPELTCLDMFYRWVK